MVLTLQPCDSVHVAERECSPARRADRLIRPSCIQQCMVKQCVDQLQQAPSAFCSCSPGEVKIQRQPLLRSAPLDSRGRILTTETWHAAGTSGQRGGAAPGRARIRVRGAQHPGVLRAARQLGAEPGGPAGGTRHEPGPGVRRGGSLLDVIPAACVRTLSWNPRQPVTGCHIQRCAPLRDAKCWGRFYACCGRCAGGADDERLSGVRLEGGRSV